MTERPWLSFSCHQELNDFTHRHFPYLMGILRALLPPMVLKFKLFLRFILTCTTSRSEYCFMSPAHLHLGIMSRMITLFAVEMVGDVLPCTKYTRKEEMLNDRKGSFNAKLSYDLYSILENSALLEEDFQNLYNQLREKMV